MYCRFCGKEVKEKTIVCTGCGRPLESPDSVSGSKGSGGWTRGLLIALVSASLVFPPIGLYAGIKGCFSTETKVKASVLLTVAVFMSLIWTALILGL